MSLSYVQSILPALLQGTAVTLYIFCFTLLFSLPLGFALAMVSMSRYRPFRVTAKCYIWLFRGTPLMLQLFFVYYGLPIFAQQISPSFADFLRMDSMTASIVTFVCNYTAYFSEIYRGGISSIEHGQYEAAQALGLSRWKSMRLVILPQALQRVLPPVCNEVITLIKDTALVTAIGVGELLKAAKDANNRDVNPTAFFAAAVIYLLLTLLFTLLASHIERRFTRFQKTKDFA